jgi:hypothetical protein
LSKLTENLIAIADQADLTSSDEAAIREAATQLEAMQAEIERYRNSLMQIEFLSTNHGGWFEDDPWKWGQMMGDEARRALGDKTLSNGGGE